MARHGEIPSSTLRACRAALVAGVLLAGCTQAESRRASSGGVDSLDPVAASARPPVRGADSAASRPTTRPTTPPTSLSNPVAAGYAGGRWFVADRQLATIHVIDSTGVEISTFGRRGGGPGELLRPTALAASESAIYVADLGNARIVEFDPDGTFRRSLRQKGACAGGIVVQLRMTRSGVILARRCRLPTGELVLQVERVNGDSLVLVAAADTQALGPKGVPIPLFDASEETFVLGEGMSGCLRIFDRASAAPRNTFCLEQFPALPIPDSVRSRLARTAGSRVPVPDSLPRLLDVRMTDGRLFVLVPADAYRARWHAVDLAHPTRGATPLGRAPSEKSFIAGGSLLVVHNTDAGLVMEVVPIER